jgi:flagellar motility protein MotE (MotC chaperone)
MKKTLLIGFGVLQFILIAVLTVYFLGMKKYGSPAEYKAKQQTQIKAVKDSSAATEITESQANKADSTLIGMSIQSHLVENNQAKEKEIKALEAMIDSLNRLKASLTGKEKALESKQQELDTGRAILQDQTTVKLAKIYDNMKAPMAVPLFVDMNDTLAVKILNKMSPRTSSRLLGLIAEKDVNKASRLNKLLAR